VADGAVVNWGALQGLARSDEERAELKWLQVLGDLANLHRSSHDEEADADSSERTHAVQPGAQTVGLESWGRYRLVRRLGAGSFGSVYCAWDPQLERNIAIKILHEHVADDRLKHRLLREGRALAKVQHPNVVQVFGVEEHGSRVGLCMELVSGETLAGVVRSRGLLSPGEAAVVGQDVCRALAAVHAAGYLHRDVKAQNVMRDKGGKIVLMDFGTGRGASSGRPGGLVGTPVYMAPELLDGKPASAQSDIYAVGVLLYLLVSGHYPVEGGTVLDLVDAHKAGRRHPLLERRPDLPMAFVNIVSRALAVNPAERWPSAAAMLEALEGAKAVNSQASTWVRTIARVLAVIVGGLAGLTLFGMVSSRYFNVTMGRAAFVSEGLGDWLYWGAVSMVAPTVLVLMVLVGLAVLRLLFRLLLWLWPRGRRIVDAMPATMRRLGLDDVETLSAIALALSVAVLGSAMWSLWAEISLLLFMDPNLATAPESLAFLSPSFEGRHTSYRYTFEWVCIILVALWWIPFRVAARRGQRLNGVMLVAAAASLLLATMLLHFPYRLLYHSELEAVEWDGRRCYVLGERGDEELLFCPDLEPPRNRAVRKGASGLTRLGTSANPFEHASSSPTERP
jgi:serine/threonine-protein kinase